MSAIIAESEQRLERVKEAISERKDLIQDLRTKLQFSSNVLHRRENKLEEKINLENDLKSEIESMNSEKNNLQSNLKEKTYLLEKEKDAVRLRDIKIKDLSHKLSDMENQLSNLYKRMSERDRELSEARHYLWNRSPCPDCTWMRKYIQKLEYQIEHYRYANYDHSYGGYQRERLNTYGPTSKPYHNTSLASHASSPSQPRSHYNKQSRNEAYKRYQAANRQRVQELRNASQILSPIREDAEEASTFNKINQEKNRDLDQERYNLPVQVETISNQTPVKNTHSFSADNSCNYLTVRSGATDLSDSVPNNENLSMAYLHIASKPSLECGDNRVHQSVAPVIGSSTSTKFAANTKGVFVCSASTPTSDNLSSRLSPIRSFPFLNSSLVSCSSVASTESPTSDTTGCSSDSGLTPKSHSKKRLKTRRIKRKQKSNIISFRTHEIDVTRFATSDFRQIMWSLGGDSESVDEFLSFLAFHAKRLQSDPQWSEKHSLGTPEEWNALKGLY